jgi:hypothetical protein
MTARLMEKVHVIEGTEYERGWGSRPDGYIAFKSKAEADAYITGYNKEYNSAAHAPDCYTTFSYIGEKWAGKKFMKRMELRHHIISSVRAAFDRLAELEAE